MANVYDGGFAAPVPVSTHIGLDEHGRMVTKFEMIGGISVRDWFAAQAVTAMAVQIAVAPQAAAILARSAYEIADALLAERSKAGGEQL